MVENCGRCCHVITEIIKNEFILMTKNVYYITWENTFLSYAGELYGTVCVECFCTNDLIHRNN